MTIEQMYAMPRDDFMDYMLKSGKYRMDLETLSVYGPRGRVLKQLLDIRGYLHVNFCMGRCGCGRSVMIHRIVALLVFGKEAIFGKDVAHRDSNKLNNYPDNLSPMIRLAHMYYDQVKRTWPACSRCNDPNGKTYGRDTPIRCKGERFGYKGQLCKTCHNTLYYRIRKQQNRDSVDTKIINYNER